MIVHRRGFLIAGVFTLSGCVTRIEDRITGDWETKKEIVSIYEDGLSHYNAGVETLEVGINYEDWEDVEERSKESIPPFEQADTRFRNAGGLCAEISEQRGQAICLDAAEKAVWMIQITEKVVEAASAFSRGERKLGDALWQEYKDLREESNEARVRSSATLSRALNHPTD